MTRRTAVVCLTVVLLPLVALAQGPSESQYSRALAAYRAGRYADSVALFDAVLRSGEFQAGTYYYRGLARARLQQYDGATADLQEAARLDPSLPVAANLGVIYYEMGRYDEARKWLEQAASATPPPPSAKLLLGVIAYEQGDFAAAERFFSEAGTDDANLGGAAEYYRGLMAMKQGQKGKALAAFSAAEATGEGAVARAAAGYRQQLETDSAQGPIVAGESLRPYSLRAFGGFEYDSNLTLEDIPGVSAQGDGRFILGVGGTYFALDGPVRASLGYDFYQSLHFDLTQYNLQSHTVGVTIDGGEGPVFVGVDGSYSYYFIGDQYTSYLQEAIGSPFVAFEEGGIGQGELYYRIRGRDYLTKLEGFDPALDGMNNAVGGRQTFYLGSNGSIDVGYQWEREDPKSGRSGRDFDYQAQFVDIGYRRTFGGSTAFEIRYGFKNYDYLHGNSRSLPVVRQFTDGTTVVSQQERRDDMNWFMILLTHYLTDEVYVQLGYRGQFNDSNIPVVGTNDFFFSYDRHIVTGTAGVVF